MCRSLGMSGRFSNQIVKETLRRRGAEEYGKRGREKQDVKKGRKPDI